MSEAAVHLASCAPAGAAANAEEPTLRGSTWQASQRSEALNALKLMPNAQTDERLRAAWQESWQAIAADTLAAG